MTAEEVGQRMTAREMTEWAAYQQVVGPVLVHERIEVGFAMLAAVMVKAWTGKDVDIRKFVPRWDQGIRPADPDSVWDGFQKLLRMARRADD